MRPFPDASHGVLAHLARHAMPRALLLVLIAALGLSVLSISGVKPAAAQPYGTASANASAVEPQTTAVILPPFRFACEMVDDETQARVYCWESGGRERHVRLDPSGEVNQSVEEAPPQGIGGPGEPYGAWVTIGRFRCEVLRRGVQCVVIATGKGFLISKTKIVEVQTAPGVTEPPPIFGKGVTAQLASGYVLIKMPGTRYFRPLNTGVRLPLGTLVDTTHGTVLLASAANPEGEKQTGLFHSGIFRVTQPNARHGSGLTELRLVGKLAGRCGPGGGSGRASAASLSPRRGQRPASAARRARRAGRRHRGKGRRLWGNAHGNFKTGGRYASATVRGTKWLTEDRCNGTLVKVARGAVKVKDFARHRTATVTAGHSYLAHRGSGRRASHGASPHALIWRALNGKVICGVAVHARGEAAKYVLCSAHPIPAPKHSSSSEGDPGFVFLAASGRPRLARLSQYSFEAKNGWLPKNQTSLGPGRKWSYGRIGVICRVAAAKVRCVNHDGHGFTITKTSYRGS
jgi:hypothetical protein